MIYCPSCNRPSTGKKALCPHCGARLSEAPDKRPAEKPPDRRPAEKPPDRPAEKPARRPAPEPVEVPRAKAAPAKREARRIGEILIAAGMLTEDQLQACLARQKKLGIRLGAILVKEQIISESQLVQALSHQADLPWVDLWNIDIPKEIGRAVPLALVQKHRFVPMDIQDGPDGGKRLYLAMDNAADREAVRAAEEASGMGVVPMFAALSAIVASIRTLYADELAAGVPSAPVVNVTAPKATAKKGRKPGWDTLSYADASVLRRRIGAAAEEPQPAPKEAAAKPASAPPLSEESWEAAPAEPPADAAARKKRSLRVMTLLDGTQIRWEDEAKAGFVVDADQEARLTEIRALAENAEEAGRLKEVLLALVELLLQKNVLSSEEILKKLKKPRGESGKGG